MNTPPRHLLKLSATSVQQDPALPLPRLLQTTNRSSNAEIDPLLAGIKVTQRYELGQQRDASSESVKLDASAKQLLAIETEDGNTLFIRADKLAEDIARIRPEAVNTEGEVDFALFRDPQATARGLSDMLWKTVSVLTMPQDTLLEKAKELVRQWVIDKALKIPEDKVYDLSSAIGVKALMWAIESKLAGHSGLYHWHADKMQASDRCLPGDPRLTAAAQGQPILVMIHGTASYTLGSYADLRNDALTWNALAQRFPGGIFGYEHRTFSQSPIENALELLAALPPGAKVSLLTHSRGGLVGDLMCLGQVSDAAIAAYRIDAQKSDDLQGLEQEAQEEQQNLRRLREQLRTQNLSIERYVRVACPARGTQFLSDNLDAALSDFLNLLQIGGSALLGVATSVLGGPVAGEVVGSGASSALGVLKRLVLEIAERRIDPHKVPGIAAMRVDSPLAAFLAHPEVRRHDAIAMAVIAGDTEFDSFGLNNLGRRVANLFCDWRLFEQQDNDLVVDTESMFAGLGTREGAQYLYDQDTSVTHFRYFLNPLTRDALRDWLVSDSLTELKTFQALNNAQKIPWSERPAFKLQRDASEAGKRPVVIFLPGIMGSHIEVNRKTDQAGSGTRIWFDLLGLGVGNLGQISYPDHVKVFPEDIWEQFYGDLADYLTQTHTVLRFAYDWRIPISDSAKLLHDTIQLASKNNPGQPIRLLAHSMGGLVVRTLMQVHADSWQTVVDSGGRLIMLGTPNNGAHQIVHTLLGKTDAIRMLEKLDTAHDMQQIVDIVGRFPGALSLLPRPGFADTGVVTRIDTQLYYRADTWKTRLQDKNTDRWYADKIGGLPPQDRLDIAENFWRTILPNNSIINPERVSYVFGQAQQTPCGVIEEPNGKLRLLFTGNGDGSVTWDSGRLANVPEEQCWYMPVEHADLTGDDTYFPAIVDLLQQGKTDKLGRLPKQRDAVAHNFTLEASPPVIPSEDELARALMGSGPRRRMPPREQQTLRVAVHAGDIRYLDQTILCGHYIGDAIAGAEAILDEMLDGCLSERERLGIYANQVGTSAIALHPANHEQRARGSQLGAIIVGLGEFNGQLSTQHVTETVRAAVLRYLLQLRDLLGVQTEDRVQLYSLLLGCNSTAHISIAESVAAVTRGVLEANWQFSQVLGKSTQRGITVTDLSFVELYRAAAITAAHATLTLPGLLASDLKRLGVRLTPARTLETGKGVRERLSTEDSAGYWPRLIVTDPDAMDSICPPECYTSCRTLPISKAMLQQLCDQPCDCTSKQPTDDLAVRDGSDPEHRYYPQRLKYVFLSQRARAEQITQQRQPGLIEAIVQQQSLINNYDAKLGRTLFQLMIPLDYKSAAREQNKLLLVLDKYTAPLPWELLQADDEPLAISTAMVRQMATPRFRTAIRTANANTACIIVSPDTTGFDRRFNGNLSRLPVLQGAISEGEAIRQTLREANWEQNNIEYCPADKSALDILAALYRRPYRIVMISAHGVFEATANDGQQYTGVVLSDGLLLTAVEIGLMEIVPEIVFLNCCHLGGVSNAYSSPSRLAYSLANELIEMGVRCVIAAGWSVNDDAACTFAKILFAELTTGAYFGDALLTARQATYRQHPGSNTWGAYQAYGDPSYRLNGQSKAPKHTTHSYVAIEELLTDIHQRHEQSKKSKRGSTKPNMQEQMLWVSRLLAQCPPAWTNCPDVLQALGDLYADQGFEGYAAARDCYEKALQCEDKHYRVSSQLLEQLANIEARHGEKLAKLGDYVTGLQLIDQAIKRIRSFANIMRSGGKEHIATEHAALLGSALKRKATALCSNTTLPWQAIAEVLQESANAYIQGINATEKAQMPYNTLNNLLLNWLCDERTATKEAIDLALRCGDEARHSFAQNKNFWNAVISADAAMIAWVLGHDGLKHPVEELYQCYCDAVESIPQSTREWDSVVSQIRLLATLLQRKEAQNAKIIILETLAQCLLPEANITAKPTIINTPKTANNPIIATCPAPAAPNTTKTSTPKGKSKSKGEDAL